ncbi:hypothetical protein IMF27_25275 [Pseudomonas sp. PCH199]|uniref:hypothetical protein n=1 Tax=unclassified Pseudomonas TaxID=196821 RepID=UPI000BCDB8BB|nr:MULTISPECIES: hypothetical protein [unclassified Pseudomonas]MCW8278461.1 hypothetical protein [Pseudomonas sp. PCH199]PAM81388.1 hypothetical protein CES87_25800 [Pseudomonas sp. ERMR1:02]
MTKAGADHSIAAPAATDLPVHPYRFQSPEEVIAGISGLAIKSIPSRTMRGESCDHIWLAVADEDQEHSVD